MLKNKTPINDFLNVYNTVQYSKSKIEVNL